MIAAAVQRALATTADELTAPWLRSQERHRPGTAPLPSTHALGASAFESGTILALPYPSYRRGGAQNLVVFADRLHSLGGSLAVRNDSGTLRQTLP